VPAAQTILPVSARSQPASARRDVLGVVGDRAARAAVGGLADDVRMLLQKPHLAEQRVYEPHLETPQWIGQACALHGVSFRTAPHGLPPSAWCAMMARSRDCVFLPQDLVQTVKALQGETWQSVGHACDLQSRVSERIGHTQPWSAVTTDGVSVYLQALVSTSTSTVSWRAASSRTCRAWSRRPSGMRRRPS
jgi:hypothetical protein